MENKKNRKSPKKNSKLKGVSYFPKQLQVVNGHIINWDKNNKVFEIKNSEGRKLTTRETESEAIAYASGMNKPAKTRTMTTKKKPSAAQLAARKKFAEAAKNGTLKRKRKSASAKKKTGLSKVSPASVKSQSSNVKSKAKPKKKLTLKKACDTIKKKPGIDPKTGQLLPGYRWRKGGGSAIKVKPAAKKAAKKKHYGQAKASQ